MIHHVRCTLDGTHRRPLLLHNGAQANPLNPYAKEMKAISRRRNKTEDDYAKLARIEWTASLYLADLGQGIQIVIPGQNVEAMIVESAKRKRQGKTAKAGIFCYGPFPLEYDGPQDIKELWEDETFRHVSTPPVRGNRVVRTRPHFPNWRLPIEIHYESELFSEEDLKALVENAGRYVGLGDWRPRYGTFEVQDWQPVRSD